MFIASFSQPRNQETFDQDTNGNLPMVGNVVAGEYHSSIINGTVFQNGNYTEGTLYLCKNSPAIGKDGNRITVTNRTTGVTTPAWNTEIISKISVLELISAEKELGTPKRLVSKGLSGSSAPVVTTEPVLQDDDDTI